MTVLSSPMSSVVSTSRGISPSGIGSDTSPVAGASGPFSLSESELNDTGEAELLSVSWNQDYGCFAAGTSRGFRIYNCDPFKETFRRDLKSGGFGIVEMLFRCNILALVGAKSNTQYPPNKLIIWDDHQSRCIGEFSFRSEIACLNLTVDGLLLATASTRGTLIRIFNTMDGTQLQEVRRGVDKADIYSIALSPNVQWLAVSSDKGTVHIFSLRVRVGDDPTPDPTAAKSQALIHQNSSTSLDALISSGTGANPSSSLSFMKGVLPKYFSSEWSFAQFHLPDITQFIAAFGPHNSVVIVGMDGSFYRCSFDPVNGGEMVQQEYFRFITTRKQA